MKLQADRLRNSQAGLHAATTRIGWTPPARGTERLPRLEGARATGKSAAAIPGTNEARSA